MMTAEQIISIEARMADERQRDLLSNLDKFIRQLELYAGQPETCPHPELLPYLEAYQLLKGNYSEVKQFLSILMDDADPRQKIFRFVVDAVETYSVESAVMGLRRAGLYEDRLLSE